MPLNLTHRRQRPEEAGPGRSHRLLKGSLLGLAGLLLGMFGLLSLVPRIVSSAWFKAELAERTALLLHRPVSLDACSWEWGKGLCIEGLTVADAPGFSARPLLSLRRLLASFSLDLFPEPVFLADLDLEAPSLHLVRDARGLSNIQALLSDLEEGRAPGAPQAGGPSLLDRVLGGGVRLGGHLSLREGHLLAEDAGRRQGLALRDVALFLGIPSLFEVPFIVTLDLLPRLEGKDLPAARMCLRVEGLFDAARALRPLEARAKADCTFPMGFLHVEGAPAREGLHGDMTLDLEVLTEALGPLLPPSAPLCAGAFRLDLRMKPEREGRIPLAFTAIGEGIRAARGLLGDKALGPLTFEIALEGDLGIRGDAFHCHRGDIRLQERTRLTMTGDATGLGQSPSLDVLLSPFTLDLQELLELGAPWIQEGQGWLPGIRKGTLSGALRIQGDPMKGDLEIAPRDLALTLQGVTGDTPGGRLSAERVGLRLPWAQGSLTGFSPGALRLEGDVRAEGLALRGEIQASLEGLDLHIEDLRIEGLSLSGETFPGIDARVGLRQSLRLAGVRIPGLPRIENLEEEMRGTATLGLGRPMAVDLRALRVAVPGLRIPGALLTPLSGWASGGGGPKGDLPLPCELLLEGGTLRLRGPHPGDWDVEGARVRLHVGETASLDLAGTLLGAGARGVRTQGLLTCDLHKLGQGLAHWFPGLGKMEGKGRVTWAFRGRLPPEGALGALGGERKGWVEGLRAMDWFERVELTLGLEDGAFSVPLRGGEPVRFTDCTLEEPLTCVAEKGFREARCRGRLRVGSVEGVPGMGSLKGPKDLALSLEVTQRDLRFLSLRESLDAGPFSLRQRMDLTLEGWDALLGPGRPEDLPGLVLERCGGRLGVELHADFEKGSPEILSGLSLQGKVSGSLGLELRSGERASWRLRWESPGFEVAYGERLALSGLTMDVRAGRSYRIVKKGDRGRKGEGFLSEGLLRPPGHLEGTGLGEGGPLAGEARAPANIAFSAASFPLGPRRLELSKGEMTLGLDPGLPSLEGLSMGLLGGSLTGRLSFLKEERGYALGLHAAFSGIDPGRMGNPAPGAGGRDPGPMEDGGGSGQVLVWLPLSPRPEETLGGLQGTLHVNRVGRRTLDRLFYALDPYESDASVQKQRAYARMGSPRRLLIRIDHGTLSMEGEIESRGLALAIPRVDRLNLTALPWFERLREGMPSQGPLLKVLDLLSADTLLEGDRGEVSLGKAGVGGK